MKFKLLVKQLSGTLFFFAIIFISAGRINYYPGIVYVIIGSIMFVLNQTIFKIDEELQKERAKPGIGAKEWDKRLLRFVFPLTLSMYIIAGLDSGRFLWSPAFPSGLFITGIILTTAGMLLFLIAQKQNKFFSSIVRIQDDRNHSVIDSGLYKIVRHPAYMASIIQLSGFPFLFGSLWSIIPVAFSILFFIVRTFLEDKTLNAELKGYDVYCKKTRFRLVPFIW